jgi:uncharacterized damage-inducible protein DinB
MTLLSSIRLMGSYNQWMNARLYEAANKLPVAAIKKDKKAFFGSILGTLNHIMVGDILWLKRFAAHPSPLHALDLIRQLEKPIALTQILYEDFSLLTKMRTKIDSDIVAWTDELTEQDLETDLAYANTKGVVSTRNFGLLIVHFFNHQTHHRGQITTLLHQEDVDVGVTDLLTLIPVQ